MYMYIKFFFLQCFFNKNLKQNTLIFDLFNKINNYSIIVIRIYLIIFIVRNLETNEIRTYTTIFYPYLFNNNGGTY